MQAPNRVPALEVAGVFKSYGPVQALRGVTLEVGPGEVFGLLGPNGAGKTSLISIIVTLEHASDGEIRVFGHDVIRESRLAKCRVGWVPQEIINSGFFSVREILVFHAGYYGISGADARIDYLLNGLDLWEHREKKVKQLSGGMKRRLMIAKALVHEPGLLLLDEPTAGVDVELRLKLWDFVQELKRDGLSILLTTHYLEEAERLCDRVAIIHRGKLRAMDRTEVLISKWSQKKIGLKLARALEPPKHPELFQAKPDEWVFLSPMHKTVGQLLSELGIETSDLADVKLEDGSLEDVFVRLTRGGEES